MQNSSLSSVMSINDENFRDFISNENLTIVMFGASWCGPCRSIKPAFQRIASEGQTISFGYCDVEEAIESVSSLGIKALPSFAAFQDGKVKQIKTTSRESDVRDLINFTFIEQ
jgi:thioredoxin-like negative regulator of GroEL